MTEFESKSKSLNLRAMGFCGVDDSVDPSLLQLISSRYSWVEWGVLFRPDLESSPRYPSWEWVQNLSIVNKENGSMMRLAGHLCQSRCQEVISGDSSFVSTLHSLGFSRVQVNATLANGVIVDSNKVSQYATNLRLSVESVPEIEWIFQLNDETQSLWDCIVADGDIPTNMSVLFDASCGKGIFTSFIRSPLTNPDVMSGYAGGLAPENIGTILNMIIDNCEGKPVWVDMESSLRVAVTDKFVLDKDVFSINKTFACIQVGVQFGLPVSRFSVVQI